MSAQQLSIHEIGVSFPDDTFGAESASGIPFTYLLRDILRTCHTVQRTQRFRREFHSSFRSHSRAFRFAEFDATQLDGLSRLASANRTCHLILGVGGGKEKRFNSVQYGHDVCHFIDDKNFIPVAEWHQPIENMVYFGMACAHA